LVDHGAAHLMSESNLTVAALKATIDQFVADAKDRREKLRDMAMKARQLALPQSAKQVADAFLEEALRG